MAERSLRGTNLSALSMESDENVTFSERQTVRYNCPQGHVIELPFSVEAELPALRGERPLREVLEELLRLEQEQSDHVPITVEDLLSIWEQFDLDPEAIGVLTAVRDLGVPCMLATNQQDHRVQHMREVRGYDDLVDGSYYSSEIGAMKPDRVFFERVLDDLGLPGEQVGFVDDVPANGRTRELETDYRAVVEEILELRGDDGRVAQFLRSSPYVTRVLYPGRSGMVSFDLAESVDVARFLKSVRVFTFAESLGGVESLVTCPSVQTHADVPVEVRASYGLSDRLMRLSVGIEHVDDLIADLAQAFEAAGV